MYIKQALSLSLTAILQPSMKSAKPHQPRFYDRVQHWVVLLTPSPHSCFCDFST